MEKANNLIQSIEIENFKAFEKLKIENLTHFNLFIGANNIGKTSVLEALAFATGSYPKAFFDDLSYEYRQEFPQKVEDYRKYFYQFDTNEVIYVKIIYNDYSTHFRVEYKSADPVSITLGQTLKGQKECFFNSITLVNQKLGDGSLQRYVHMDLSKDSDAVKEQVKKNYYTELKSKRNFPSNIIFEDKNPITIWYIDHKDLSEREKALLDDLRIEKKLVAFAKRIDARIETIRADGKQLKIYYKGIDLPFTLNEMGTGFIQIVKLYLAILLDDINIILCDEITDGLHPNTIQILLDEIIPRLVEQNIQLFATSHSYDILQKIAEYPKEKEESISAYRIFQMPEEKIEIRQLSPEHIAKFLSIAELR